jgi:hypothetical protein
LTGSGIFRPRPFGAAGYLDRSTRPMTMKPYADIRAMLARMERARTETAQHLATVERQIEARAERLTVTTQAKSRQSRHRRSNSMWTLTDERIFQ